MLTIARSLRMLLTVFYVINIEYKNEIVLFVHETIFR